MADRGPVIRVDGSGRHPITINPRAPYPPPLTDGNTDDEEHFGPVVVDSIVPHPKRTDPKSRTLNVSGLGTIVPIVYGHTQVGGRVRYLHSVGSLLYVVILIAEGPIDNVTDLYFGETSFASLGLHAVTDYNIYYGTPDQAVDPIIASVEPKWVYKMPATAYIAMKLNINGANMDQVDPFSFRCTTYGRKLRDHRSFPTLLFADRLYSENPALATFDFLTSQRFGFGAQDDETDLDSWDEAADDCDVVDITIGGGVNPTVAPTVAIVSGGTIEYGSFQEAYTWVDTAGVESLPSPWSSTVVVSISSPLNRRILVSAIANGGGSIATKNVYRRKLAADGITWGPAQRVISGLAATITTYGDITPTAALPGGTPPGSNSVLQFRIGMRIDQEDTVGSTLEAMRGVFTAFLVFNNGLYQCYVDKARTPTDFSYDQTTIIGIPTLRVRDPSEIPTQVQLTFIDEKNKYTQGNASYPEFPEYDSAERADRIIQTVNMDGIPTFDQGYRVCKWWFKRSNRAMEIDWRTSQIGALPVPGSIVSVSHGRLGLPASLVIVTSCSPAEDRMYWDLKGEFFDSGDYDNTYYINPGQPPPTIDPPPPDDPPAPSDDYILRVGIGITSTYVAPLPE